MCVVATTYYRGERRAATHQSIFRNPTKGQTPERGSRQVFSWFSLVVTRIFTLLVKFEACTL